MQPGGAEQRGDSCSGQGRERWREVVSQIQHSMQFKPYELCISGIFSFDILRLQLLKGN